MAEIVNLTGRRKQRDRAAEADRAADNRARHGRTKQQKARDAQLAARRDAVLDGARLEPAADEPER